MDDPGGKGWLNHTKVSMYERCSTQSTLLAVVSNTKQVINCTVECSDLLNLNNWLEVIFGTCLGLEFHFNHLTSGRFTPFMSRPFLTDNWVVVWHWTQIKCPFSPQIYFFVSIWLHLCFALLTEKMKILPIGSRCVYSLLCVPYLEAQNRTYMRSCAQLLPCSCKTHNQLNLPFIVIFSSHK